MKGLVFAVTAALLLGAQPAQPQAAADSLYRLAKRMLTDRDYSRAVENLDAVMKRFPKWTYAGDALYWKGFALYRQGELKSAATALDDAAAQYPGAATRADAAALAMTIKSELAKRGNVEAKREVDSAAQSSSSGCEDMEMRIAAMDAVQQMDPDRATPLIKRVLARRDDCSVPLRKTAVFILGSRRTDETETMLLEVAKNDPSLEVKKDAVFHLQSGKSDKAVAALEEILLRGSDEALRSDAMFALSSMKGDHARKIIRDIALDKNASMKLRKDAIFYLASKPGEDDVSWMRQAYATVADDQLRNDIMFQIASKQTPEVSKWLVSVAQDGKESMEVRKNALFFLASRKDVNADMSSIYDAGSPAVKREVIFYLASRKDGASLDKLISIAKKDPDQSLRKEALFHLGQSKDPKAMKAIEDLVVP